MRKKLTETLRRRILQNVIQGVLINEQVPCFLDETGKLIKPQPSRDGVGKPRISTQETAGLPAFLFISGGLSYANHRSKIPPRFSRPDRMHSCYLSLPFSCTGEMPNDLLRNFL